MRTLPRDDLRFSNTIGILQKKKKTMWFIGVEVEQETSAPPPKKNPGSAPAGGFECTVLQRNLKEWHGRQRTYVCERCKEM